MSHNVIDYFLQPSELDYELPDFAQVQHIIDEGAMVAACETAIAEHDEEITAIVANPAAPNWENTVEALERSGQTLQRVLAIIYNYSGVLATDTILDIEETVTPLVAAHTSNMLLNEALWSRFKAVPQPAADTEDAALYRYWERRFIRGGADLSADARAELRELDAKLASLTSSFGNTLQKATRAAGVLFTDKTLLEGLSDEDLASLAAAAVEDGRIAEGEPGWLVRIGLPSVQPIVESLEHPEARHMVAEASLHRAGGATNETLKAIAVARARRAALLGYATHADFVAEEETAGSREAVEALLRQLTPAAVANAAGEYKRAVELAGLNGVAAVGQADWPYWAGKLRAEDLSLDEAELKKYFPLDKVLVDGAFYAAERLYGIVVEPRKDLAGYHEDVQVWEVKEKDSGEGIGLLLTDMFARPTKRGGAWMSAYVEQSNLIGQAPVIVNVMNIAKPAPGEPALLSMDEVVTVFHEFGHALHGLLSDVRYPSLSGTNVPRDFVEFPSQINENWALEPEVLENYARHVDTGEVLPASLVSAVRAQSQWGQGFATTEYLAACWVDLAWHTLTEETAKAVDSVDAFEAEALREAGIEVADVLAPRYRSAYFNHIFAGGYSADYWSYIWAEVLDADGFQAFVDTGAARGAQAAEGLAGDQQHNESDSHDGDAHNGVQPEVVIDEEDVRFAGERFRRMILSRGATIDYADAFWMFRGQERSVEPLLRRRGLGGA